MSLLTKVSNKIQYAVSKNLDDPEAAEYANQQKAQAIQDSLAEQREKDQKEEEAAAEAKKAEDEKEAADLARRSEFKATRAGSDSAKEILKIFGSIILTLLMLYGGHIAANEAIGYGNPFRLVSFLYGAIFFFYVIPRSFYETFYLKRARHFYTFLPLSTYVPTGYFANLFLTPFCYVEDSFSAEAKKAVEALYANGLAQSLKTVAAVGAVASTIGAVVANKANSPKKSEVPVAAEVLKAPEPPKVEASKVEAPKVEASKVEAPKVEASKAPEPPKVEAPKAPEIEVFRITPEVGKCYEHIEATRSENMGQGERRYFSENSPRYVGKYIRTETMGSGDGQTVEAFFDDNGTQNSVKYSYEGYTCFIEVPCKLSIMKKTTN